MKTWTLIDYGGEEFSMWGLPFEMYEHVDPELQRVIVSECYEQRMVFNVNRERYHLLSRCPEVCRDLHVYAGHRFGSPSMIRGWFQLTEIADENGDFMEVNLDDLRAWKAASDAQARENEKSEGIRRLMRTGDEINAGHDEVADKDLDELVDKTTDRMLTNTRSSRVLPTQPRRGRGLILPKHVARQVREDRAKRRQAQ